MADPYNFGNIRTSSIEWDGAVGDEGGFVKFDGPVAGGKALISNLMAYNSKHGLNTVSGIISRWAPPSENDTPAYIKNVADGLGVDPNEPLDMRSPEVLGRMAALIARQEKGRDFDPDFFKQIAGNVAAGKPMDAMTQVYAETDKEGSFTKATKRAAALSEFSPVKVDTAGVSFDVPADEPPAMYDEDAARLANQQLHAGFQESVLDSLVHGTVTGKLVEMAQRGEYDPAFNPMSEDNKKRAQAAGLYGNDQLMDYINGAQNADDYAQRLQVAQERQEYARRLSNTEGLQFASAITGQLIGGVADPVTIISTMGAGAAVSAARSAAAASRAMSIASAGFAGAAGNVAVGEALNVADNQRFSWGGLFEQATTGAALGALGGLMVDHRGMALADPRAAVAPESLPMMTAAAQAVQSVVDGGTTRAFEAGTIRFGELRGSTRNDSLSTDIHEMTSYELPSMGALNVKLAPKAEGEGRLTAAEVLRAAGEEPRVYTTADYPSRLGYTPAPSLDNPVYRSLHDAGVVTELRSADDLYRVSDFQRRYGEKLPDDAKAVYLPQEDRVFVFKDRLTPAEQANPSGLVMHEVGVHYGLERTVGTENYTRILRDLEQSADPRVREAMRAVPGDTPEHLKLEEALGYLVEKHPTLGIVRQFIANLRNWMRENLRVFRGLAVSAEDAIAYVKGSVEHVRREGRLSADLTYPYVWHGSPVKGIESLDLKYAGSGEGRSAFGHGHYVTSEKGTALDYRNKEAQRRGLAPEDGGLYRLKVNAKAEDMLEWDAPVGAHADAFRKLGVEATGTGGDAYNTLADKLGSQRAASEALHAAGIPGIRYETGRTRGTGTPNSNYVLFDNAGLSMEARYSRGGDKPTLPLNAREQRIAEGLDAVGEQVTPEMADQAARAQKWLDNRPEWFKGMASWAASPGVTLSRSESKVARIAGSILFENTMGSTGNRPSTVSLNYEMLQRGYRDPYLMEIRKDMVALMSPKERADYQFLGGAREAVERISDQVAEERLRHRMAIARGEKYVSQAEPAVQRIAAQMDSQIAKMAADGRAVGNPYAEQVDGGGVVGFMPQVWKWDKFSDVYRSDPATWAALRKNFVQQYMERQVDPVLKKMTEDGAMPEEIDAVRARLVQQVQHQVDTRMTESIRDPNSRTNMDSEKFETMAKDLLDENFHGLKVTDEVVNNFRKVLGEKIKDRSRTEFDLLREVDGHRLLDFVEHDVVSTVQHTAHRFAGKNAMAKAGFKDEADFEALITLATKDGATPEEVELLAFAGRAFGFRPMIAQDHPMLAALRNFVYAATMGKLGIANLADVAATATAVGVKGMFKTIGYAFKPESELMKMLAVRAPGLLGQDYRIHSMTADVLPNGRAMTGMGARMLRVSQKAAELVSWINGANFVQKMLHRGFLPVLAEDLSTAIRGGDGGMNLRRLADAGIDGETAARIKAQLEKYDAGRQEGGAFNWDQWDDQQAADKFIEAMHRVTYQTFQRALTGEAAAWRSESALGSIIGQFHNFGITATEKQLGRNLAINDMNTYTALMVGMAWSALLYYARLQVNTAGMSRADADEYMKKNTEGSKLAIGTLTYFNMSGIAAEIGGLGEVVFGGNTYQAGSGPVAAVGYLGNAAKALNSAGSLLTGQSDKPSKDARNILRILPGGNSIAGSYYSNYLRDVE
jgi:hypothetical protein